MLYHVSLFLTKLAYTFSCSRRKCIINTTVQSLCPRYYVTTLSFVFELKWVAALWRRFRYLVHVKSFKHLLDVGIGAGGQILQSEELLELVEGELPRRALGHELPVPLMNLAGCDFLHRSTAGVSHCEKWTAFTASCQQPATQKSRQQAEI